ncbi:MAG: RNA pseudouridine synthase [Rhodoferax sp.]|nr:RNA pseudouridine synthase [Rhodoferax sp.]
MTPVSAGPAGDELLTVLYADNALLVLDKPAGLLSVPGRGEDKQDCLSKRAQTRYPDALIVHRLDMATSGLIIMARGPDNQRRLSIAFAERQVRKRYVALVDGLLLQDAGTTRTIDLPINVDWPNRPRQVIDFASGKASVTNLRVLSHEPSQVATRVELEPLTGRSHQLRVHMQAMGHPILGDTLYASPQVQSKCARLALHALSLELLHPQSGRPLKLHSPPEF